MSIQWVSSSDDRKGKQIKNAVSWPFSVEIFGFLNAFMTLAQHFKDIDLKFLGWMYLVFWVVKIHFQGRLVWKKCGGLAENGIKL